MSDRVCTECAYCEHHGVGYSEWTIMGERLLCMMKQPLDVDTETASDAEIAKAVSFANDCAHFREGTGPRLGLYSDDDAKEMLDWVKANNLLVPETGP